MAAIHTGITAQHVMALGETNRVVVPDQLLNSSSSCHFYQEWRNRDMELLEPHLTHRQEPHLIHRQEPHLIHRVEPHLIHRQEPHLKHRQEPHLIHRQEPHLIHRMEPHLIHRQEPHPIHRVEPHLIHRQEPHLIHRVEPLLMPFKAMVDLWTKSCLPTHHLQKVLIRELQRQRVQTVPITQVLYSHKDKSANYFVFGLEHKVHAPDYPATCCCGCSIL
ncbi:hypothetical protein RRG08_059482 [Elysia crispata]|uniref:Uncharacterized protein n=1 Tax=Elysia crispata TaxID=231223 RepID=A0AAE1DS39_9GAST|nr:hypothetical protein RRG08_059482 [Elysia crispata]